MTENKPIKLPSLLSFDRKLETSDALMYSGNWITVTEKNETGNTEKEIEVWKKIKISPRYNRSTQSADGTSEEKMMEPNPVSSGNDDANLLSGNDTLKVSFTMRVIGNVGLPFACNAPDFEKAIKEKVNAFKESTQLETLAHRYAYNIANGRFLWRNRVCAEDIEVHVFINKEETPLIFKAYKFSLKEFATEADDSALKKLSSYLKQGLNSENDFVFIKVDAYVKLGDQQHVYPSEEMNMNKAKTDGKTLFQLDSCAAMHNVKIGNAIRTIDNWYGTENAKSKKGDKAIAMDLEASDIRPIAIEPFGSVTQRGAAYRTTKIDLYTLMIEWVNETDNDKINEDNKNYIVANLIRGGVFSKSKKK